MFVAHLPAGYLLTRRIARRPSAWQWAVGLGASVLPDLDLVRFYLFDHRRVPHHAYGTHEPLWWALVAIPSFGAAWLQRSREGALMVAVFFGNVFGHLALDTVVGRIRWLAPFSERSFAFVTVPAVHGWWVWSFVLHWTFLVEVVITACAIRELARDSGFGIAQLIGRARVVPGPRGEPHERCRARSNR